MILYKIFKDLINLLYFTIGTNLCLLGDFKVIIKLIFINLKTRR